MNIVKKYWSIALLLFLGVLLMLVGSCENLFKSGTSSTPAESLMPVVSELEASVNPNMASDSLMTREERELARDLRLMLEKVAGAGNVEVTIRLSASTNSDYALDTNTSLKTTQENDQSGGSREITENTDSSAVVMARGEQGLERPVVRKEIAPGVTGVLVVAQGASKAKVKADLFKAVQVALGAEPHKILVLPMKEEK